jgi:hypothetical protein
MIEQIDAELLTLLTGIQLDAEAMFVDVLPQPPDSADDFAGFPSCAYFYQNTDSDYSTVSENRRDYFFEIYLYGIYSTKTLRQQYVLMYKQIDKVIDALDKSNDLNINDIMVRPTPAEIVRITSERGDGLRGHIRIKCSTDSNILS